MEEEWPSAKVRQTFIDFFTEKHEHLFVPSSPCFPADDPTIMFTNAGMNQFKPIFLGTLNPTSPKAAWKRVANSQKCIRAGGKHNDLDEVGFDFTHHTFFEMLGNWSFGDYFRDEAIDWHHDLIVNIYKLDKSRLYVTYFGGDESQGLSPDLETRDRWLKYFPENHVIAKGMEDNFWEMGDVGPCGGCTELHYDTRHDTRSPTDVITDETPGVVEICNLVFICYNREPSGKLTILPHKHVDTGMGFERMTSILQNKKSNYDSDVFSEIMHAIQTEIGCEKYTGLPGTIGTTDKTVLKDIGYRIISDHIRTLTFAVADGAVPGSDGRGYVLRRILRRAVRAGKEFLGAKEGFFHKLVDAVVQKFGVFYPELLTQSNKVKSIIKKEETAFDRTLSTGINQFNKVTKNMKPGDVLSGSDTYLLSGTHGFPLDLIQVMCAEKDLFVDIQGYEKILKEIKDQAAKVLKSKSTSVFKLSPIAISTLQSNKSITDDSSKYKSEVLESSQLIAIWQGSQEEGSFVETVSELAECAIILDKTNFYAQSGGQMFDSGILTSSTGAKFFVREVQVFAGYVLHFGAVASGIFNLKDSINCSINNENRRYTTINHTSTHILNYSLRKFLGRDVDQRGSVVCPEKLRFDFTCNEALTPEQIKNVGELVNQVVSNDLPIFTQEISIDQAQKIKGVRALFAEQYPDPVRVVSVGADLAKALASPQDDWDNFSIEFCGGTHINSTSEIEIFVITAEEAIGQGERRIHAVTGHEGRKAVEEGERLYKQVLELVDLPVDQKLQSIYQSLKHDIDTSIIPYLKKQEIRSFCEKNIEAKIQSVGREQYKNKKKDSQNVKQTIIDELKQNPSQCVAVKVIEVEGNSKLMSNTTVSLLKDCKTEVGREIAIMLLSVEPKSKNLIIQANVPPSLVEKGLKANEWINSSIPGGKCGSPKADIAQGKSAQTEDLESVAKSAMEWAQKKL